MKARVLYIDMAKGFAMITIVMLHLSLFNLCGDAALKINFFNHCFNVKLFFFLSGMVAALSHADFSRWKDIKLFFQNKTLRLLLSFVVWSVIILPFVYNRSDINQFGHFLIAPFLPPYQDYWFILYLYVILLLFLVTKVVSSRMSSVVRNDCMREMVVMVPLSLVLFPIYEYVFIFFLGYFLFRYGKNLLLADASLGISACLFMVLFTFYRECNGENMPYPVAIIMALSAIVTVVGLLYRYEQEAGSQTSSRLLSYIGCHSLEIYLLHYYLLWICKDCFISVAAIHAIPLYMIVFMVSLIISLLCCYMADLMKKIPYVSFFLFGNR